MQRITLTVSLALAALLAFFATPPGTAAAAPLDGLEAAIAEAIRWLMEHPVEAEAMGQHGRQAIEQRFNWQREEEKLLELYRRMLEQEQPAGVVGEVQ